MLKVPQAAGSRCAWRGGGARRRLPLARLEAATSPGLCERGRGGSRGRCALDAGVARASCSGGRPVWQT